METRVKEKEITIKVRMSEDTVTVRQTVRQWARELDFSLIDQTKIVTAASELARNMIDFAGGGVMHMEIVNRDGRKGMKLTFRDQGPGIADMELALTNGYTTRGGLGLGLSGAKRLVNEFDISSQVGKGTEVTIIRWK
ncbi:MAG: anti-sigma regulatory factor [Deltaproteobacteria bacterium]|nr:anti-sigma regulatory factor [Deltaproteobacteria bacterium]